MLSAFKYPIPSLVSHLVQTQLLTSELAEQAITESRENPISVITYLIQQKWIHPTALAAVIAYDFGLPLFAIEGLDSKTFSSLVDEKLIHRHQIFPLWQKEKTLYIAIADPTNQLALDEIKFHTGLSIQFVIVAADKLSQKIAHYENQIKEISNNNDIEKLTRDIKEDLSLISTPTPEQDTPIARYVNKILTDAIAKNASDIHFEPFEKEYRIRYRIDGILYPIENPAIHLAHRITARIKILAELDISERRIPQDGRFKIIRSQQHVIDFRVSTCPTIHGEKMVIRILDSHAAALRIDELGLEPWQQTLFENAIEKPQGMILVTGPTGSGKTITLYTGLSILNTDSVNISTVENPVEIYLPGINQVNINSKAGLNFAVAMRAFLRQDPDIIMVGEIRDLETAEIAIQAAQTGHLVLSTLHTNSAAETLTRLANMGIPGYHLATSVSLIIAQRLARKLCSLCKKKIHLSENKLLAEGFLKNEIERLEIYAPQGCEFCTHGYQGRVGIFELLSISESIGNLMIQHQDALTLVKEARAQGMQTLRESGLNIVRWGITSLEEVNRVTKD